MFEVDNKIWMNDIEELSKDVLFEKLNNKIILITGATGLIGKELIFSILCANRLKNLNIKVVALVRNLKKAKKIFKNVLDNSNLIFIVQDICEALLIQQKVDYIIHCASITQSKAMVENPVQTILTTFIGTKNVLDFAQDNKIKSMVYLSSIEMYGKNNQEKEDIIEDDYGVLDSLKLRNNYPISKKMAENLCISYSCQFNLDIKIARLTQTFGAGVDINDNRLYSYLAKNIIKNSEIILKTDGSSSKNYCYITDTISAILTILLNGENKNAYNVANYDTCISVKDLAKFLIKKYNKSSLKIELSKNNLYPVNSNIKLNANKLENLGWKPKYNLEIMFDKLINYFIQEGT